MIEIWVCFESVSSSRVAQTLGQALITQIVMAFILKGTLTCVGVRVKDCTHTHTV